MDKIDVVKNINLKKNVIFVKNNALNYLKKTNRNFDVILIKQTIHFFKKNQINLLLNYSKLKLSSKGKILIFSLKAKDNQIPCFKKMKNKLISSLKKDDFLFKIIFSRYSPLNLQLLYSRLENRRASALCLHCTVPERERERERRKEKRERERQREREKQDSKNCSPPHCEWLIT